MSQRMTRHGSHLASFCLLCLIVPPVLADDPLPVRSKRLDIEYAVNERAMPLSAVRLWYTVDRGQSWVSAGEDGDRQTPFTVEAPQEGLLGFFLVLENGTGASSAPPNAGTAPQLSAFVDYSLPVVQLHAPRRTTLLGHRVLQIRWTAIDGQLGPRPVELQFRRIPSDQWENATAEPLPNTGRYDWRVPEELDGAIDVRIRVRDLGGHVVETDPQSVDVRMHSASATANARTSLIGQEPLPHMALQRRLGATQAKERAARLFADAVTAGAQGEYRKSIGALRDVVRLNPQHAEAFAEMGEMLYRIGDFERALNAYELALQRQPTMRTALRGAAKVHRQKQDLGAAASRLRTVLRHDPDDAEVWVDLGDVAIYQGDDVLARECYTRAMQIDPSATRAIEDARTRLELMAEVSRTYNASER
ncbi:MAG: tetratricopeptide repeat protein [Phycisphaerae bacterium]